MTKKTRTIIFLSCLLLFFLIAPSAVFYSQGYRVDFENKKIAQTGGLFLKIIPRQANIYLDGKLSKKTDFFFGSILIENLLPKKYKIKVQKEGYHSWEKALEIKEKEVTEAKNIILFPQNISFDAILSQVEHFWISPDQRKIILKENQEINEKISWSLKFYDLDRNIKIHLLNESDFFTKKIILNEKSEPSSFAKAELISLKFSEDSKKIYLEIKTEKKEIINFTLEDFNKTNPLLKETLPPVLPTKEITAYLQNGNDVYYLDNNGHFFKTNEKLSLQPLQIKQEAKYDLMIFQGFIFLTEDDNLYKFNYDLKIFELFFEKTNFLRLSPDNKKLAYFSNNEIWIIFLKDKIDPPQKKEGENLFLIRLSEKISDVYWINDNYILFTAGNNVKISEIDDRDKINIIDIIETKKLPGDESLRQISWNQYDKKIYLLSEAGKLYSSNPILP